MKVVQNKYLNLIVLAIYIELAISRVHNREEPLFYGVAVHMYMIYIIVCTRQIISIETFGKMGVASVTQYVMNNCQCDAESFTHFTPL